MLAVKFYVISGNSLSNKNLIMSRIGKKVVEIPKSVTVTLDNNLVKVKGPKGELSQEISDLIKVNLEGDSLSVSRVNEQDRDSLALYGLSRTLLANMVHGVSEMFERKLEMQWCAKYEIAKLKSPQGGFHPPAITQVHMEAIAAYDWCQVCWRVMCRIVEEINDHDCPMDLTDGELFAWWV